MNACPGRKPTTEDRSFHRHTPAPTQPAGLLLGQFVKALLLGYRTVRYNVRESSTMRVDLTKQTVAVPPFPTRTCATSAL